MDNGYILWDSHAINAYLVGKYGNDDILYPKDLTKRGRVDQRLHFDCGVLFTAMRQAVVRQFSVYLSTKFLSFCLFLFHRYLWYLKEKKKFDGQPLIT